MSLSTAAIRARLAGDVTLASLVTTFAGSPAVFSEDPPPEAAVLPYIIVSGEVAGAHEDTLDGMGRTSLRDVRCYTEQTGSQVVVEAMAERVWTLLHRQHAAMAVTLPGLWQVVCEGPIAVDDGRAYGRIVTVRLHWRVQ